MTYNVFGGTLILALSKLDSSETCEKHIFDLQRALRFCNIFLCNAPCRNATFATVALLRAHGLSQ